MADLKFEVDVKGISEEFGKMAKQVQTDLVEAVGNLATMTHAKTQELAKDLGSLSRIYQENLEFDNPQEGFWVVTLKKPAMFIEEGMKGGFMDWLLNSNSPSARSRTKISKNGKYRVIPFVHSKNPTEISHKAQKLVNEIKEYMKQQNLSWNKIETGPNGSPRIGRLHTFDVSSARLKPQHKTGVLEKVNVIQVKNKESGKVERHIVTFRVISEKHKSEGLWFHPGREPKKLMDKAYEWAYETWEKEILPAIMKKYEGNK